MTSGATAHKPQVLHGYDDELTALSDQAIDHLVHLHSGDADLVAHREFVVWRAQSDAHERAARDAEALLGAVGETTTARQRDWLNSAAKTSRTTSAVSPRRTRQPTSFWGGLVRRRPMVSGLVVCAVLLMMIIGGVQESGMWARWNADFTTETGQYQSVHLPDGSVAHMNTASAFSIDFSGDVREVTMTSGEVIFDVAKDANRPFIVSALDGQAMAVGTMYGVRIKDDCAKVTVQEGIVEVRNGDGSALRLSAGEQAIYQNGQAPKLNGDADLGGYGSWQRGKLIFNSRPLGDVIDEAQRHTSGRIVIARDALRDMKVTGVFETAALDDLLQSIEQTTGAGVLKLPLLTVIY